MSGDDDDSKRQILQIQKKTTHEQIHLFKNFGKLHLKMVLVYEDEGKQCST